MRRAASVASAFMEATAAWRPRMTGRMVWAESSVCARVWGVSAKRRTEATAEKADRGNRRDIGLCTSSGWRVQFIVESAENLAVQIVESPRALSAVASVSVEALRTPSEAYRCGRGEVPAP